VSHPGSIRLRLKSSLYKILLASVSIALIALYSGLVARDFLAAHAAARGGQADLARAVQLEPSNSEYHHRLGTLLAASGDFSAAQRQYEHAASLNPHAAQYWLDQANIFERNGDSRSQQHAIEKAIQADPRTPEVAWQAANLYLVQGQTGKALQQFRLVLEGSPDMAPSVLDLAWRATHDADRLLAHTLPPDPAVYFAFIDVLDGYHELAGAEKVWGGLMQLRQPVDVAHGLAYVNYLIEQKQIPQAVEAWQQLASVNHMGSYLPSENLIVNGGFDADILNGGFDWQYSRQADVELSLDDATFHGGHRSLQVAFRGPGVDEVKMSHLVPLAPNSAYDFSAYFKTLQVEGAGGPRLAIVDAFTGQPYFTSDDLKNAEVWRQLGGSFTTGPAAQLATVKILRVPEGRPIRGTLWLDDLELKKK
jgi:tetratricopeptide (TPR) repeat protein